MIYLIVILIILHALREAFFHDGHKLVAGFIDMAYLSVMICGVVLMSGEWKWILICLLLRYAVFDLIYNLIRGLPVFYIGTTKPYDKLIRKVFHENSKHFLFITKLMALATAIGLML